MSDEPKEPKEYDTGDLLLILAVRHLDGLEVIKMVGAMSIHFGEEVALDAARVMSRIASAHKERGPLLYSALSALQTSPPTAEQRLSRIEAHTARLEGRSTPAMDAADAEFFNKVGDTFRTADRPQDTCDCWVCQLKRTLQAAAKSAEPTVPDHKAN